MRVLHVSAYFAPAFVYGGPPRSILGLCQGLQTVGVEVQVFTTTANGRSDFVPSRNGGDIHEGVPVRYFPRKFPKSFFRVDGLAEAIRSTAGRYDLLHIHGLWNLTVWASAGQARALGIPYVISPRGMLNRGAMNHQNLRKRLAYPLVERRNLAAARLLHATSESEAQAIARYGLGPRIAIVPNGVELETGSNGPRGEFRRKYGLEAEAPLIVFLGRIHPIKRLDLLAAAFDRVRAAAPAARLVVAGPDEGGHRKTIEPLFARSSQAVIWTGELAQAEQQALLRDASACVLCSDSENFGMSVLEALSAGVPVVATHTCPWPELETAQCGRWVEQTPAAIAEALIHLLQQATEAQAMGRRGRRLVEKKYGWDTVAGQMADCYASLLAARG